MAQPPVPQLEPDEPNSEGEAAPEQGPAPEQGAATAETSPKRARLAADEADTQIGPEVAETQEDDSAEAELPATQEDDAEASSPSPDRQPLTQLPQARRSPQDVARSRSRSREGPSLPEAESRSSAVLLGSTECLSDADEAMWSKETLPPPREHELEFIIKDPRSFRQGKNTLSEIREMQGAFRFRLLIFPMGTDSTGRPEQLAGFVEVVPPEGTEGRWAYEQVRYQITVVNWKDYRRSMTQLDTFTFQRDTSDRGWHRGFVKAIDMTKESGWLNENGELCLRAACSTRRAMLIMPSSGPTGATNRRSVGYVGLKNHGATCYMNCLLQTLYHIGAFRHMVYSMDVQESLDQAAAGSGDDAVDTMGGANDERPALPLLVALQNLFYRLQTSEVVVSCRELMRSFGWDTADAFMQHDAQELNRLLCDRIEEQMKGTPMDGEIKRLFEGEMENYIECVDVEYRSTRQETFYDLQLNVRNDAGKDLTSLEESLRDFTSEEIMEDDNAYDAGEHGKQRARKGIRFKRFPPVLHIQLKRFMFDVERLDMCKLNGRHEFPQKLDMEAFAPGSGTYQLHTVVVHSGGVSSGHYYAFVRERGENGSTRWVKFDDEQVTPCSEHAAVEDNYGGEDTDIWNYFNLSAQELRDRSPPRIARIHNAYMLSYVRQDVADNILAPPNLEGEDTNYQRLSERCTREARLAEDRKRAKVEQMTRIDIRVLLERDLLTLPGFWTHHDLPCTHKLTMAREQTGEELYRELGELMNVSSKHLSLFLLTHRRTQQRRFKWIQRDQALRAHVPAHNGAPHSPSSDPHFVILCMASRDYEPDTLLLRRLRPASDEVNGFENIPFDDDVVMLIVKYFCPSKQRLVCLGCYYCHHDEAVESMLNDEDWFLERLRPFVERKEVVMPDQDALRSPTSLSCYEEFDAKKPEDIMRRDVIRTIREEGLLNGDILIWQPERTEVHTNASEVSCLVTIDSHKVPIFPKNLICVMQEPKMRGYAWALLQTLGRLHRRMSTPSLRDPKHARLALQFWFKAVIKAYLEPEPLATADDFEELQCLEDREQVTAMRDRELEHIELEREEVTAMRDRERAEGAPVEDLESEDDKRLTGLVPMRIDEMTRRDGDPMPSLEHAFPVTNASDYLQKLNSQVATVVRVNNAAEMLWAVDNDSAQHKPGDTSVTGDDRVCMKCNLHVKPGSQVCECGAKVIGEMRELTVDMRWPVPTFMARVMEAVGENPEESNLWLYTKPPVRSIDAPCFCTEDFSWNTLPPVMRGNFRDANYARRYFSADKIMLDVAARTDFPGDQGRWMFHVASIPRPPQGQEASRPVKVHFFNNIVKEVGSAIFHVPFRGEYDVMDVDGETINVSSSIRTGRPTLCPAELMKLVREFIDKDPALNEMLMPPSGALSKLPLRLLDIFQSRIKEVARFDGDGQEVLSGAGLHENGKDTWEARGHNFLSEPLRVEPDWDYTSFAESSKACTSSPEDEAEQSREEVEVFHCASSETLAFDHPCIIHLRDGEAPDLAIKEKLKVSDAEFAKWVLMQQLGTSRTSIDAEWMSDHRRSPRERRSICVERRSPFHRNRSPDSRGLRVMKPLTIRGGSTTEAKKSPPVNL